MQVNLEIECDSANAKRLEYALRNAEFEPDSEQVWRWRMITDEFRAEIKFELLADLEDRANELMFLFDDCDGLGAVNLRDTRFATQDVESRILVAKVGGERRSVEINVTGVAGFLLAKCAAAYSRRKDKDWYDIAFVLLHNDLGGPEQAALAVVDRLGADAVSASQTALRELAASFEKPTDQGPMSYAEQFLLDHPEQDPSQVKADAIAAVQEFCQILRG